MARTEISTMGEFGLIKHLTKEMKPVQSSTKKAVGDDCAVMDFSKGERLKAKGERDSQRVLMTTDMLLEGIHFNLEYVPLKHLGYKAAVVNFSDIYAMNGMPTQITVSLGVSKRFSVEDIEELYSGIRLACERYGVDIVGGDTCDQPLGALEADSFHALDAVHVLRQDGLTNFFRRERREHHPGRSNPYSGYTDQQAEKLAFVFCGESVVEFLVLPDIMMDVGGSLRFPLECFESLQRNKDTVADSGVFQNEFRGRKLHDLSFDVVNHIANLCKFAHLSNVFYVASRHS